MPAVNRDFMGNPGRNNTIDEQLGKIFRFVFGERGIDFSLYRRATVIRKLDLRMHDTKTLGYAEYLALLKSHPEELDSLIKALTIKVSNFFRNPLVFELLSSVVLPALIASSKKLRIWSLGCAGGEEPYSVAIIVHDLLKNERHDVDCKIIGTDLCDESIQKAVRGVYPEEELSEVKKRHLEEYFEKVLDHSVSQHSREHRYCVKDEIKSMVRFECGDISNRLKERKDSAELFDLVLCRNVLIYMNRSLQDKVLKGILGVLKDGGYLIIGASETIPDIFSDKFCRIYPGMKIFRKTAGAEIDRM